MKQWLRYVLLLVAGAALMGIVLRACDSDAEIERKLAESQAKIDSLEAKNEMLEQERTLKADSLQHFRRRVALLDQDLDVATRARRAAERELRNQPTYETLSDDQLAARADSLFIARAGSAPDTSGLFDGLLCNPSVDGICAPPH